jgi:hypothetical protein
MHIKRVVSLAVAVLGVILVIYALSSMRRISDAKGTVKSISSTISGSPVGKAVGSGLSHKASQYDTEVTVLLIVGIVLVVVGCGGVYHYRRLHK